MNARPSARPSLLKWGLLKLGAAMALGLAPLADLSAGDYYNPVPFLPTVRLGGEGATRAFDTYGKEYSEIRDHTAYGAPDPLQVVSWDGREGRIGGNSGSVDGFDYGRVTSFNFPNGQVDALANSGDFLFPQVIRNESTLLFSVTGDSFGGAPKAHVHYEDPLGGHAVWAAIEAPPVDVGTGEGVNHHKVFDVDALEVWGPEPPRHDDLFGPPKVVVEGYIGGYPGPNTADSNRFSLDGDSVSGTSVWAYDITLSTITPWIPHSEIVTAIETLFLPAGHVFDQRTRDLIDVDATMARDIDGPPAFPGGFPGYNIGDELLFSIKPIVDAGIIDPTGGTTVVIGLIDGGEIMHLAKTGVGVGAATIAISYLKHGGHTWDTAFPVALTFGYDSENVDGLESVGTLTGDFEIPTIPEPAGLVLGALAAPLLALRRRRR